MFALHQIPSEAKIKKEIKKVVFGKTLFCHRCGSKQIKKYEGRYRCRNAPPPMQASGQLWNVS